MLWTLCLTLGFGVKIKILSYLTLALGHLHRRPSCPCPFSSFVPRSLVLLGRKSYFTPHKFSTLASASISLAFLKVSNSPLNTNFGNPNCYFGTARPLRSFNLCTSLQSHTATGCLLDKTDCVKETSPGSRREAKRKMWCDR